MTRRGFTLLEIMIGLLVSAFAIAIAYRTTSVATAATISLAQRDQVLSTQANGRRWLGEALGSLESGTDSARVFDGLPERLAGTTWLVGPGGWPVRTSVELRLQDRALIGITSSDRVTLFRNVVAIKFEYLLDSGRDATWVERWSSPVSIPIAIRLILARSGSDGAATITGHLWVDTTVVVVGGRG